MLRLEFLIIIFIICNGCNTKKSNSIVGNLKSDNGKTKLSLSMSNVSSVDPIEKVKDYLKNNFTKDTVFVDYLWEEVEVWDALSFKYVVRFEKRDGESFTITLDSLGNINIVMFSNEIKEFYNYYDSSGVPKNFYSSRKLEKIGYEKGYEMIVIDENGILSVVGDIPDSSNFMDSSFYKFILNAIPGSDSMDFKNVKRVMWSNQIYNGDEFEFEVENDVMKNIKTWP